MYLLFAETFFNVLLQKFTGISQAEPNHATGPGIWLCVTPSLCSNWLHSFLFLEEHKLFIHVDSLGVEVLYCVLIDTPLTRLTTDEPQLLFFKSIISLCGCLLIQRISQLLMRLTWSNSWTPVFPGRGKQ